MLRPLRARARAQDRLGAIEAALTSRTVDLCLVLLGPDGREVLRVGGKWDRVRRAYVGPAERAKVLRLEPSQVDAASVFAEWLRAAQAGEKRRIRILMLGGERGSGKTHLAALLLVVIALAFPGCYMPAINRTSDERAEIEHLFRNNIPQGWFTIFGAPKMSVLFETGSIIKFLSGEAPAAARRAALPIMAVLINEAQEQDRTVFDHSMPGIRNLGGLVIITSNPPREDAPQGEWTAELRDSLLSEDGSQRGRFVHLAAAANRAVDQAALDDIGFFLRAVSPDTAAADAAGIWKRLGTFAYAGFNPARREMGGHVGDPPDLGWFDVTEQVTAERYRWYTFGAYSGRTGWPNLGGLDFQKKPHLPSVLAKLYERPDGALVVYFHTELLSEHNEQEQLEDILDAGFRPPDALLVGDSTGAHQNAERKRGGHYSHDWFSAAGWTIVAPRRPSNPERYRVGRNPRLPDSLSQVDELFRAGRILVSPRCTWLIESLKKCKLKDTVKGKVLDEKGGFTHVTDCLRYVCWFAVPRREPPPQRVQGTIKTLGTRRAGE